MQLTKMDGEDFSCFKTAALRISSQTSRFAMAKKKNGGHLRPPSLLVSLLTHKIKIKALSSLGLLPQVYQLHP